jgi:DNA-binding transcriptional regulator YhcF (GntR family)/site-specific recombinase XerD
LKRAVRWRWVSASPITQAEPPPAPKPDPRPPTASEAARIINEAWAADRDWGALVWLTMVTGIRRGELCALRWRHVDMDTGVLAVRQSIWQRGKQVGEKDTKDHQKRRVALDTETLAVLVEHRRRWEDRAAELGVELRNDAFVFSLAPDGSTHLLPDSVSQRYGDLVARLGIATTIHKLRHYSATELIAAGVDARTVAGRLGHGGGGITTLRYYTAWVSESDQRAASTLAARMPARPGEDTLARQASHPYQWIAADLREQIADGRYLVGDLLPGQKKIAAECGVSVGTANRALHVLANEGSVQVIPGHGFRVTDRVPASSLDQLDAPTAVDTAAVVDPAPGAMLLDATLRLGGQVVSRFAVEADPRDADDLRQVLLDAVMRRGSDASEIGAYEMDLRLTGDGALITTFVATGTRRAQIDATVSPAGNATRPRR